LTDYVDEAAKCGKIENETQRRACQDVAFLSYKSCGLNCTKKHNACKDKCDEKAAEGHKICEGMQNGPGIAKCRQAVEEQRGDCYRNCDKN